MVKQKFLNGAGVLTLWEAIKSIVSDINTTIKNNELVTASALTDINTTIKNNELVTASALTDLDTRIDNIEGLVAKTSPIIEKTYEELKSIKMDGQLIPGQQYKITDYETTTSQENTESAGNLFDIIVTANSNNSFSEVARAIYNPNRDTYFENSNLDAWKIWYCFDNEQDRFNWATSNGTGVIYRMIDEWNNDCPYDFKNIVMEDFSSSLPGGGLYYTFTVLYDDGDSGRADASLYGYCHNNTIKPACDYYNGEYKYFLNPNIFISYDVTILHENFLDYGCKNNVFGYNCNSNKLGFNCRSNIFGNNCQYNTFGNECCSNTFGNNCNANIFGNNCNANTFDNLCSSNIFSNNNECNIFGNNCQYNIFYNECSFNNFGNYFESNTFGNGCMYNSFRISGNKTSSLIPYCRYNIFDDGCSNNIIYSSNTNSSNYLENYHINRGVKGTYGTPMLVDAQYLNSENVCNVYKKGDVAVVAYIQY